MLQEENMIIPQGPTESLLSFSKVNPCSTKRLVWKAFSEDPLKKSVKETKLVKKYPNSLLIKKLKTTIKGETYKILLLEARRAPQENHIFEDLADKKRFIEVRNSTGIVVASVARPDDCKFKWENLLLYRGLLIITPLSLNWRYDNICYCLKLEKMISGSGCALVKFNIHRYFDFYNFAPVAVDHSTEPETILIVFDIERESYLGRFGDLNLVITSAKEPKELTLVKPVVSSIHKSGPELLFSTLLSYSHYTIESILVDENAIIWINVKTPLSKYSGYILVLSPDFSLLFEGKTFNDLYLDNVEGQIVASFAPPESRRLLLSLE